jgi:hypothetical protein
LWNINQTEGKAMSNRSIIIMVLVLIGATAYLLLKGDGNVDMSGEKHGAEATLQLKLKSNLLSRGISRGLPRFFYAPMFNIATI